MDKEKVLRKTLSANIKKHREQLGFTQEKLAETAGISANMINNIECCRTWISDKTLVKLATALKIEIYRLFIPLTASDNDISKTVVKDLAQDLQRIHKDINTSFTTALKSMGAKKVQRSEERNNNIRIQIVDVDKKIVEIHKTKVILDRDVVLCMECKPKKSIKQ